MKVFTVLTACSCILIGGLWLSSNSVQPMASDCIQDAGEEALRECLDQVIEWQEAEALLVDHTQEADDGEHEANK
jgi:hypothetical protein